MKGDLNLTIAGVFLKLVLPVCFILNNSNYYNISLYHFISLLGTFCFCISFWNEIKRENKFLIILSIVGVLVYQPFYSVLKTDTLAGDIIIDKIIPLFTIAWCLLSIIIDAARIIKDYKNRGSRTRTL
jgi:hypothetical protein